MARIATKVAKKSYGTPFHENISEKISSILFMKGYTPPFIKGLSIKRPPLHTVFRISSFILYILKVALFIVVGKNGGFFCINFDQKVCV